MHPNPIFRAADYARCLAFARERGFGILTIAPQRDSEETWPLAAHIPFLIEEDGTALSAHIVRSNPIYPALKNGPVKALIAISGPDSYISPDWYGVPDQVPTWNYVAVQIRGTLRLLPQTALRPHLDALSGAFEARLAPKPVWRTEKMDREALERMMRMIVPIEMEITRLDGTWKLGQNKPDGVRKSAAEAVSGDGIGSEYAALAALMAEPPV